jgi:hypothetical protein
LKSAKNFIQITLKSEPKTPKPNFTPINPITKLIQELVNKHPNKLADLFILKSAAKTSEKIIPVPGKTPQKTPKATLKDIFCGEPSILIRLFKKSFKEVFFLFSDNFLFA